MKWTMNYNNYNTLFFALISILLFFAILKWIYYLFQNHYIEKIQESFRVSGNVNIPINTTEDNYKNNYVNDNINSNRLHRNISISKNEINLIK